MTIMNDFINRNFQNILGVNINREIKFRGKRKDNGEWIDGGYTEHDGKVYIVTWIRCNPDTRDWDTVEYYENNSHYHSTLIEVDPTTVCQYTGLKDESGKEIYEGDICKFFDNEYNANLLAVVKFGEYKQDGSNGEYSPTTTIGFYVEIFKWEYTEYSFCDVEEYPEWNRTMSVLKAMDESNYEGFEVIGNIYENSKLLEGD